MKGLSAKGLLRALGISLLLYVGLLALAAWLTLRGILPEERLGGAALLCTALTAFASALLCRSVYKEPGLLLLTAHAGGFFLVLLLLLLPLFGGTLSWGDMALSLALAALALPASNAVYRGGGFGKRRRGRRRQANR